jgi:hypothetical protein
MFNKKIVHEALKLSLASESGGNSFSGNQTELHDSIISLLIHDIFGGDILKTPGNERWHFYNRVEGERVDFALTKKKKIRKADRFEDIPSTPDETYDYFDWVDYSAFFLRFVRAFEETIGLGKYKADLQA